MANSKIAVIIEGERTEPAIFKNLSNLFFSGADATEHLEVIQFPYCGNIYQFYHNYIEEFNNSDLPFDTISLLQERIKAQSDRDPTFRANFASQINQLLSYKKEDFSQIFLFFDAELQDIEEHKNTIIETLMELFSDETENGKLYLSYPMIEALKDTRQGPPCDDGCLIPTDNISSYKRDVAQNSAHNDTRKYDKATWQKFCHYAVCRASCLWREKHPNCSPTNNANSISFKEYKTNCFPKNLYYQQYANYISQNPSHIIVLSSIPLFLLDYYPEPFWNKMITPAMPPDPCH